MKCRRCGAQISDDAAYCSACGEPTAERGDDGSETNFGLHTVSESKPEASVAYAGFWLRAVAWVVDMFLLGVVVGIFILNPLLPRAGISPDNPKAVFNTGNPQVLAINLLVLMAEWCYFGLLESSPWQASVGKRLLGLYVTDQQGKRVSFARASGRFWGMYLSTLTIGIGYLMAGFTPRKQALHDLLAKCLVLKKTSRRK
ncbi:MAG: RDD family protein [Acidobacteriota bacterium]|nr:RDD family protein [Acidobacteriota bacterium]